MTISEPDDALLSAVVIKLFADRQLSVDPTVINYLTMRMERSLAAARTVVSAIDTLALTRQRKVTRATAAEALTRVQSASEG
jgi:chromosomal replication initiation ATPase DnaA